MRNLYITIEIDPKQACWEEIHIGSKGYSKIHDTLDMTEITTIADSVHFNILFEIEE